MSVRTGIFPPPSVGPMTSGMPGPMPPMGAAPNPFAPMPPMPLAGMPPPPMMGGMPPPPMMGGMPPPPPMAQAPMPQPSSAGLGSVAGSNAPRRRMFGDFLESKLSSSQPRPAPQMPPQMMPQQQMVAPGTPAMRTPPMQSMMPRPMMYGGEVDIFGYEDGGPVVQYMEDGGLSQVEQLLVKNHGYTDAGNGMVMTKGGLLYDHEAGDTFSDRLVSGLSSDQIGNTESTERMAPPDDRISRGSTLQIQETPSGRYAVVDTSGEGITFSDIYSGTNSSDFGDKYSKYFDPSSTLGSTGLSYADREAAMNLLNKYGYNYGGDYVAPVVEEPVDSGGGDVVVASPVSSITGSQSGAGIPVGAGGNFGTGGYTADPVDLSEVNPIDYSQFTGDVGNFSNTGEDFALYGPKINIPQSVSQYMTGPSGGLTTSYGPEMVATSPIGAIKLPARPVSIDIFDWLSTPTYGTMYSGISPINTGGFDLYDYDGVSEMRMGGEATRPFGGSSVPRQTMIGDDPHMLAYINPEEAQLLKDLGGTGEPGPGGIPAYRPSDFAAERTGTGAYSHATDGDDDNKSSNTSAAVAAANKAAAESMLSAGVGNVGGNSATDFINKNDDNDDDVADVFGTGNIFTETTPGASIINYGTGSSSSDDDKTYTDTSSISGISEASGVDYNTGTGAGSSGLDDDKTYTDTSSIAGISDASGVDYNAGGSGSVSVYTPSPVYVPPVYTDKRGNTYDSQAEADAANQAIDAFNTQLMSYGAGKEGFKRFADKVESPYIPREDSDRAASQIYSTRFTPELAGYDGPDILGGIYSKIPGIGGSDLGTGDSGVTAQPIVDSGIDTSQSSSQQLGQYGIDDDIFNLTPEGDTLSQAVRADVSYNPNEMNRDPYISYNPNEMNRDTDSGDSSFSNIYSSGLGSMTAEEFRANEDAMSQGLGTPDNSTISDVIKGFEGYSKVPYYDVNANRAGYGSDTKTDPITGKVTKITKGTTVSKAEAEADLARRLTQDTILPDGTVQKGFINSVVDKIGADTFYTMTPSQQAALTSITYNYGSLPDRVASVVNNVDPSTAEGQAAISAAISSLGADNDGINKNRREQEAALFLGTASANEVQDLTPGQNAARTVTKEAIRATKPGASDDEITKIKAQLDASVPVQGFGKFMANVGKGLFLGLGADFVQSLVDKTEAERANIVEMHMNAINNGATPKYDDDGKYIGYDNSTTATFGQKVLASDNIMEFMPPGPDNPDAVDGGANEAFQTLYDAQSKAAELDPYGASTENGFVTSDGQEYVVTPNGTVVKVENSGNPFFSEDGATKIVGTGESILNSGLGTGTEVAGVFNDGDDTNVTSGDDDATSTEVDTGYTTDENGNKICNQAGYVYDVATDSCIPAVAEEESTDTSLNIGSGASRSFEDVLKNIQTKATTIAPISANIKPMAQGGMAGLNRTADNFLRALGG